MGQFWGGDQYNWGGKFSLGCGIFEMILKNSSGNIEQPVGYCSHQHIHN